ncbi:MAG: DUF547 domain-containing protein [Planctomycetes bacterium]|nr:DUF547 domain-containing protein [Planctomycetota bacterium]
MRNKAMKMQSRSLTIAAAMKVFAIGLSAVLAAACSTIDVPVAKTAPPRDAKNAFSHADFDAVLKKITDKTGRVDYGGLRLEHAQLDKYLGQLAQTSPENDKSLFPNKWHQMAYWVNAYNASVIRQIIEKNITDTVGDSLPSRMKFFGVLSGVIVGGERMSLDEIEKKASFSGDPRVHFLISNGTLGGPRLRAEAPGGENFDKIAEEAAVEFCNDPRNVRTGPKNNDNPEGSLTLSEVFDRFEREFVDYARGRGVAGPTVRDAINFWRKDNRVPVNGKNYYFDFEWALNKREPGQK